MLRQPFPCIILVTGLLAAGAAAAGTTPLGPTGTNGAQAGAGPVQSEGDAVSLLRPWDDEVAAWMAEAVPEAEAGIGPGSALRITHEDGTFLCTANFVWMDETGRRHLGTAGHCLMPEGRLATHGPDADYDPAGTRVEVRAGACPASGMGIACGIGGDASPWVSLGTVTYAIYTGLGRDFGIVEIPVSLYDRIRLEMPTWGGPDSEGTMQAGDTVLLHGQGRGYGEVFATRPRIGIGTGSSSNDWGAAGAANPGDSGSGVVTGDQGTGALSGKAAVGILTHALSAPPGVIVPGAFAGTHVSVARSLTADHTGLDVWTLPGGQGVVRPPDDDDGDDGDQTLPPGPAVVQHEHNETTTRSYNHTWPNEDDAVRVTLNAATTSGTVRAEIRAPDGAVLYEMSVDTDLYDDRTLSPAPTGTWTLTLDFQGHSGTLALRLEADEEDDAGPGDNGSRDGDGDGDGDAGGKPLPGPGGVALAVLSAVLAGFARRRARRRDPA